MTVGEDRIADFLEGTRRRNRREIISPEGVPLVVELAGYGERAIAFVLDLLFMALAVALIFLIGFVVVFSMSVASVASVAVAALLVITLLVRVFYFIRFELMWQGATPGKRIVGLRVIDRRGGPLRPASVIARNLTREFEMFLPAQMLLAFGAVGAWEELAAALWGLLFTFLPLVNRDCMRAGDLIAGTLVVSLPRRALLGDLVDAAQHHSFGEKQLGVYGAFELQILEELLRRQDGVETRRLKRDVTEKIVRKIAWPSPIAERDVELFLRDFYAAERAHLERAQLLGKSRADKHTQAPSDARSG